MNNIFKNKHLRLFMRLLIGIVFMVSASLKILDLDKLEIYIYSFDVVNFILSGIAARLLIIFEFVVGFWLIFRIYYKWAWLLLFNITLLFTFFLLYVLFFRTDNNCHCMGSIIEIDPLHSIIKNIGIMLIMLFIRIEKEAVFRFKKVINIVIISASVIVTFVLFAPDALYGYFIKGDQIINSVALENSFQDSTFYQHIINIDQTINKNDQVIEIANEPLPKNNENQLFAIIHSGCEYCKMGMQKIKLIFDRNEISYSKMNVLVWGDDLHIIEFIKETESQHFSFWVIDAIKAIELSNGHFPAFAILNNNKIIAEYNYRTLSEQELIKYLK